MTLGGVARVAMEQYRQHVQNEMFNHISKKLNMAVDIKTAKFGSTNGDTLSCEFSNHSNAATSHFIFFHHSAFFLLASFYTSIHLPQFDFLSILQQLIGYIFFLLAIQPWKSTTLTNF